MREIEAMDISSSQPGKSHDVEASTFLQALTAPKSLRMRRFVLKEKSCWL
jgi:hypothetical protein